MKRAGTSPRFTRRFAAFVVVLILAFAVRCNAATLVEQNWWRTGTYTVPEFRFKHFLTFVGKLPWERIAVGLTASASRVYASTTNRVQMFDFAGHACGSFPLASDGAFSDHGIFTYANESLVYSYDDGRRNVLYATDRNGKGGNVIGAFQVAAVDRSSGTVATFLDGDLHFFRVDNGASKPLGRAHVFDRALYRREKYTMHMQYVDGSLLVLRYDGTRARVSVFDRAASRMRPLTTIASSEPPEVTDSGFAFMNITGGASSRPWQYIGRWKKLAHFPLGDKLVSTTMDADGRVYSFLKPQRFAGSLRYPITNVYETSRGGMRVVGRVAGSSTVLITP